MDNLLSKEEMQAVIDGNHGNVFAVLGIHRDKGSKKVFPFKLCTLNSFFVFNDLTLTKK